jgi:hypothetical protein
MARVTQAAKDKHREANRKWREKKRRERQGVGSSPEVGRGTGEGSAPPLPADEPMMQAQPIRIGVIEETGTPSISAPLHESASAIPEAGAEIISTGEPGAATDDTKKTEEPTLTLDPKTCVQLTKGVFALASLFTKQEHWKISDEEIEPIAEPMARQLQRIPIIAALGQNAADLIILGSTLGTLVFLRVQETQRLNAEEVARLRARDNVRDMRPGETRETFRSGEQFQEVREPREPEPNLSIFREGTA